ncbi:thioredoxin domain-containing protein [Clostridium cylindrosporum]|uniref:Thioredoxin domain protein n=1 Tax=Clostridium cylindrosporum DSM 605 TaxID=1121307 RepID=A0A0J8D9L6_CLOCY|nr:thioredoxin domain-containing protein [Clostridium cylindrosporum]KMT20998.1 thioredoxin domain protein [Clostridium cylindrosporum DSM 605]
MPNKLIHEKSPYLLQHANNPVDWYPWNEEAFTKAKREDKPIFLSIGYSTCHWCHVMERESFEDNEVADYLNKHFISIKVDREERPDVDSIYMSACQEFTGSGGWPLSIFMDTDKKPFYAGTYYPKKDTVGMTGFMTLLESIVYYWENKRDDLMEQANDIANSINQSNNELKSINNSIPEITYKQLSRNFDSIYGGFSHAPKFPSPHNLFFLLKYSNIYKEKHAIDMCIKTLDAMQAGGMFDHIGYGFSRYSTDDMWLVPHFEKMLYDNALLCMAYSECYDITKDEKYAETADKIIQYLTRDLYSSDDVFFSAEDADSEGVEGKFYVFKKDEVISVLGDKAVEFCKYYNITDRGNFEGKNILNLIKSEVPEDRKEFVEECRKALFNYREQRTRPARDEKILTSQNGLAIAALAIAGRVMKNEEYISYAASAVEFILKNMQTKNNKLIARYCDGEAKYLGYAEDYAYFIWGLIELYTSTFNEFYLDKALSLNEIFIESFFDKEGYGFYLYDKDSESLIMRPKEIYDGATPSANSVAVHNILRLSRLTHNMELEDLAKKTLEAFMSTIESIPIGHTFSSMNILCLQSGSTDVTLVGDSIEELSDMINTLRDQYHPFINIRVITDSKNEKYKKVSGLATAYVCKDFSCSPPITSIDKLNSLLSKNKN